MKRVGLWLISALMLSCADKNDTVENEQDQLNSDELTGESIYNLTSNWLRPDSTEFHLVELQGRPQVLAMIYTSCQAACPRIVADMKHIELQLGDDAPEVGFVLVSIDPEHDKPARLHTFAHENQLDQKRWTLLYGEASEVRELAAVLGVRYKKITPLDFAHSNIITVLNPAGEIVYQQDGLGANPNETMTRIREILNGKS